MRGEHVFRKGISLFVLAIPYLLFAILLSLCFFCRPSAEDLAINYYSTNPGILDFVRSFYQKEGSRYFSFPIVTLICHSRFMLDHYWILPLLLMIYILAGIERSSTIDGRFPGFDKFHQNKFTGSPQFCPLHIVPFYSK